MEEPLQSREDLLAEIARLRARLAEPEETVDAIRHGEVDAFVVLEESGERVYTLATTELLRQLHLITDSLPVLVSYVDRDRRYRFVNQQHGSWFGGPLAELSGATMTAVLGEAAYESVREHVDEALRGREVTFERWVPFRTGKRFVHATYVPHLHDREVQGFIALIEDVSERKRTGDALRLLADAGKTLSESLGGEERLDEAARLAVPAFADWCVIDLVKDDGGSERIVSLHADPARQLLMEELKRHPLPWDGPSTPAEVLRTGEPAFSPELPASRIETGLRGEDHARVVYQLAPRSSIVVPLVARGRRLGVWSFVYAESGRRYREEDVGVAQELARRVAVALDNSRLYRALEAANAAKDHFLANLSHELRTPLTPVLAMASRLEVDDRVPAGVRSGLEMIRRNIELEARLIDDLLDLTRITRGKLDLHAEATDLRRVIRQAVETCGEPALTGRRLVLDLAAEDHRVWGDPARLAQVFWNLLSNALKFTPEGGTIRVRSTLEEQPDDASLVVEVADSGIGIAPEELPQIFNAFDQGRPSIARRFGGLGLGLAIGRSIVEMHGGRLTAASGGLNQGTTLTVRLPLLRALPAGSAADSTGAGDASLPAPRSAPGAGRCLQILLVEDHADTAEAMADLLADMGHRVTVAGTVTAAAAAAERGGVDLVVSDIGLPDGDGYELMRLLATRHGLRGIALSGYGMEEDIARSREAGFALHVTKPVNLDGLRAAIRRLTDPPAPPG